MVADGPQGVQLGTDCILECTAIRNGLLEDTLTLHRLGLFDELGKSLKTTNCIESLTGEVDGYIDDVKRWHHSPQRHQWMALAVMEAEDGFRRLDGYEDLPRLQAALKEAIPDEE